jgi:hypothetical protein
MRGVSRDSSVRSDRMIDLHEKHAASIRRHPYDRVATI